MKQDNVVWLDKSRASTSVNGASFSESLPDSRIDINEVVFDIQEDSIMPEQISVKEYVELKSDIAEIKTSLNWLKWIIPLFITVSIFVSGIIVNSIKESSTAQFKLLDAKLDTIQKLNSMQIQRDVAIEIKNQKQAK